MATEVVRERCYTGVGSRKTPPPVCGALTVVARRLARVGYTLRSGGAPGADLAFEAGAGSRKQIYLPWRAFNGSSSPLYEFELEILARAETIAAAHHPAWWRLAQTDRKLHSRNVFQVLGEDLESPSDFMICWTRGGELSGGTAQALRIAASYRVPIVNLGSLTGQKDLQDVLNRFAPPW